MREPARLRRAEADLVEQVPEPRLAPPHVADAVNDQRLHDQLADRHPRIERAERVLKDDLHPPPHPPHLRRLEAEEVDAVERDAARRRLRQPQHQPPGRGLAATALADEAQRLAPHDVEVEAVDRHHAAAGLTDAARSEPLAQTAHLEERPGHEGRSGNR